MKTSIKILSLLLFFTSFLIYSCSSDDDSGAMNNNNNNMNNNNNSEPCGGITCMNGGACVDDVCVCTNGYTGADCGTAKDIETITINKITITDFPQKDPQEAEWDGNSGPDVTVEIIRGVTSVHLDNRPCIDAENNVTNPNADPCIFDFPAGLDLTETMSSHVINVLDFDTPSQSDLMGAISISNPNQFFQDEGFPATITLSAGTISMELEVEYEFVQ